MANNKVKFLRGTSDKYAVAEKDSDAIYFTTDDGKLYIGDKEVSGDQNAFSNVVVGSTTITADTATDTLTLVGSNITLTPDATNDKVTIGITKANVTSALGYTPSNTKSATITLTTSSWSSNSQTVSSSIVTSSNIIIVSPIPSNQDLYSNCGVKCTSQSSGSLVFTCDTTPDSDISVNIVVL